MWLKEIVQPEIFSHFHVVSTVLFSFFCKLQNEMSGTMLRFSRLFAINEAFRSVPRTKPPYDFRRHAIPVHAHYFNAALEPGSINQCLLFLYAKQKPERSALGLFLFFKRKVNIYFHILRPLQDNE